MQTPSLSTSSEIPASQDNVIADALKAAEKTVATDAQKANEGIKQTNKELLKEELEAAKKAEAMEQMQKWANGLLHAKNRHNTPFDGRKRKVRAAKLRRAKKANKKRKLYLRYRKQS